MSDPNQNPSTPQNPPTPPSTPATPSSDPPSTGNPPVDPNAPKPAEEPKGPLSEDNKSPEAPEPFDESKLTLPEGMEGSEVLDEFKNFAKEAGFKHSHAEKLLEMSAKAIKANLEAQTAAWHRQQNDWLTAIKADPELGPNLEADVQTFAKVAGDRELSDPEFRKVLDFTGAGTHPAVVRTLVRWAKALSEGGLISGSPAGRDRQGSAVPSQKSAAERLYPGGPHTGGPKLS